LLLYFDSLTHKKSVYAMRPATSAWFGRMVLRSSFLEILRVVLEEFNKLKSDLRNCKWRVLREHHKKPTWTDFKRFASLVQKWLFWRSCCEKGWHTSTAVGNETYLTDQNWRFRIVSNLFQVSETPRSFNGGSFFPFFFSS
jgi:hypothetical protein